MAELEALIFDVDGTLADTEETHRLAFNRMFKEFGLDWDWTLKLYEELLTISGGKERIAFYDQELAANFSNRDEFRKHVIEMHAVKTRMYAEMLISGDIALRPGVERLIAAARKAGLKLAIATSSALSNVKTLLDNNLDPDWRNWFEVVKTCDTVGQKKPAPDVYLEVLEELGVAPAHCIAFEDTENGLKAATGAGIATIITTHWFTRDHYFPNAALVVNHLGEPDDPFDVAAGDPGDHGYVNLALLENIITNRPSLEPIQDHRDELQLASV